ncbi:MAG: hypothetical protein LBR53_12300 [Deltaproteobacteria bacterium]|jgi:hypothetical protein|nr:hypothetical protein [Deltaproteobacteria bacterium]
MNISQNNLNPYASADTNKIIYSAIVESPHDTTSQTDDSSLFLLPLPSNINIFISIYKTFSLLTNPVVSEQVRAVLKGLFRPLKIINDIVPIINVLPQLNLVQLEDKSALLEWNFENFRFGFKFYNDITDNNCYYVTNDDINNCFYTESYIIDELFLNNIHKIIYFVLKNT